MVGDLAAFLVLPKRMVRAMTEGMLDVIKLRYHCIHEPVKGNQRD